MQAESNRLAPPPAYEDLPPVAVPYFMPQTHIPDAYKTEKKPPGPVGAPNLMAGAGLTMASNIVGSIASGVSAYGKYSTPSGSGRISGGQSDGWGTWGDHSYGGYGPNPGDATPDKPFYS